jgi:hypothetical protein
LIRALRWYDNLDPEWLQPEGYAINFSRSRYHIGDSLAVSIDMLLGLDDNSKFPKYNVDGLFTADSIVNRSDHHDQWSFLVR